YGAARKNYMAELLCQRLTGQQEEKFTSAAMQHGTDTEPAARAMYMLETGADVTETGFIPHPSIAMSGASPDGLVSEDGLIEIKCPNTATHLEFLQNRKPKHEYLLQMQWQMACTGRQWCDFISYDDRLPEKLAYRCIRIPRDDKLIAELEEEAVKFLTELDKTVHQLEEQAA
ncbi:MAG: YqaJ viral recombinase family protein, partial [Eikenella corrodens]|uniref:lambda exonuclease family protein n=1 Tax=Eikenella corrodens TaxID=539 RepID=UPI0029086942